MSRRLITSWFSISFIIVGLCFLCRIKIDCCCRCRYLFRLLILFCLVFGSVCCMTFWLLLLSFGRRWLLRFGHRHTLLLGWCCVLSGAWVLALCLRRLRIICFSCGLHRRS